MIRYFNIITHVASVVGSALWEFFLPVTAFLVCTSYEHVYLVLLLLTILFAVIFRKKNGLYKKSDLETFILFLIIVIALHLIYSFFSVRNLIFLSYFVPLMDSYKTVITYGFWSILPRSFISLIYLIVLIKGYFDLKNQLVSSNKESGHKDPLVDATIIYFLIISLTALIGMSLLILSKNLMLTYIALEIQSLSLLILISLRKNGKFSVEGSLKYFVLGACGSACFLIGAALIYSELGTFTYTNIAKFFLEGGSAESFHSPEWNSVHTTISTKLGFSTRVEVYRWLNVTFFASILLFIGFFLKFSLVPFHSWTADVYHGAKPLSSVFIANISKIPVLFVICLLFHRVFAYLYMYNLEYTIFIVIVGISTIIVGLISAYSQNKLRRFLAYSTIVHSGLIIMGTLSMVGFQVSIFYLMVYTIANLGIWIFITGVKILTKKESLSGLETEYNLRSLEYFSDLSYIIDGYKAILLKIAVLILFCSIAGIPPLVGFWAKFELITIIINHSNLLVGIIVILLNVIAAFYYLRFLKALLFDSKSKYFLSLYSKQIRKEDTIVVIPNYVLAVVLLLTIIIVILTVYNTFYLETIASFFPVV